MPDDDEQPEPDPGEMFVSPFTAITNPQQYAEAVRRQADQQQMASEIWKHEVRDFMANATPEHLATVRRMLDAVSASPNFESAVGLANFWEGMIISALDFKHGRCVSCGQDHESEFHKWATDAQDEEGA